MEKPIQHGLPRPENMGPPPPPPRPGMPDRDRERRDKYRQAFPHGRTGSPRR